jgi:hypothetical protein
MLPKPFYPKFVLLKSFTLIINGFLQDIHSFFHSQPGDYLASKSSASSQQVNLHQASSNFKLSDDSYTNRIKW